MIICLLLFDSHVMCNDHCALCNDQEQDCVIRVTAATPQRRQSNPTPSHTFRVRHKVVVVVTITIFDIITMMSITISLTNHINVIKYMEL